MTDKAKVGSVGVYKTGEPVSPVRLQVIEDRGHIGYNGRRILRVRFENGDVLELPEEEISFEEEAPSQEIDVNYAFETLRKFTNTSPENPLLTRQLDIIRWILQQLHEDGSDWQVALTYLFGAQVQYKRYYPRYESHHIWTGMFVPTFGVGDQNIGVELRAWTQEGVLHFIKIPIWEIYPGVDVKIREVGGLYGNYTWTPCEACAEQPVRVECTQCKGDGWYSKEREALREQAKPDPEPEKTKRSWDFEPWGGM